ncbi:hypothetical protein FOPE_03243 [Fonsecaea pedrosoi]|nr:hypothetical protein FOPE_03243 [Fonsecaea pedrosoi]
MAPNLSDEQRLEYIASEREYIEEVLEDAQDCKWPYQALIECTMLESKLQTSLEEEGWGKVALWLEKLKQLDPLRRGRWTEMGQQLGKQRVMQH